MISLTQMSVAASGTCPEPIPAPGRSHPRCGFTFIELIAALSVILLLAAILLPVLAHGRLVARRAACISNLTELGAALHLYAEDYEGRFPPAGPPVGSAMMPYVKNWGVFLCPSAPGLQEFQRTVAAEPPDARESPGSARYAEFGYLYHGGYTNGDWGDLPVMRDRGIWHDGGGNLLRLDGSVRWLPAAELPDLSGTTAPASGKKPVP